MIKDKNNRCIVVVVLFVGNDFTAIVADRLSSIFLRLKVCNIRGTESEWVLKDNLKYASPFAKLMKKFTKNGLTSAGLLLLGI